MRLAVVLVSVTVSSMFLCGVNAQERSTRDESVATFEVASVKPSDGGLFAISPYGFNRFSVRNVSLTLLVSFAYGVSDADVIAGPASRVSKLYEIEAKAEDSVLLNYENLKPRLRALLAERFHLVAHREMKNVAGYRLVVLKGRRKLKASEATTPNPFIYPGGLRAAAASADLLASLLSRVVGRPVVNETHLAGMYEIALAYAPEGSTDSSQPSVFTAVQEQLGLKLEPHSVPHEVIVVDRAEHPTPD